MKKTMLRAIASAMALSSVVAGCSSGGGQSADTSTLYRLATNVEQGRGDTGAFKPGVTGDHLAAGDRVRTDDTGHAEIDWPDKSLTRLGPATTVRISPLAKPERRLVKIVLDVGQTWNRVERVTGSGGYEVQTPVGAATVRGTRFAVSCTAEPVCIFQVVEGTVVVTPTGGAPITLVAGQALTLTKQPPAAAPQTPGVDALRADPWIAQNLRLDALPVDERGAALTGATTTTAPSRQARLLFSRSSPDASDADLFVLEADGSTRQLTAVTFSDSDDPGATMRSAVTQPEFSPDGRQIVAVGQAGSTEFVTVIDANPSSPIKELPERGGDGGASSPHWSPDGKLIVFTGRNGTDGNLVYLVNPDGSGERVVRGTASVLEATFTPDGKRLLLGLSTPDSQGFIAKFGTVALDGSDYRDLVSPQNLPDRPMGLSYSPDGQFLAMTTGGSGCSGDAYVLRADNSAPATSPRVARRSGQCSTVSTAPEWVSDGKQLVVSIEDEAQGTESGLFVIDTAGTGYRRLTTALDADPDLFGDGLPAVGAKSGGSPLPRTDG
ncbi:MAG TPA: FecR domain-containing protein [Acidimicrobiales bacterium]|nr:FecR domain-containing protein [Acidimicrobiales bacterium]